MLTKNDLSQIKIIVQEVIDPKIQTLEQSTKKDLKTLETGLKDNLKTGLKGLETKFTNDMKNMEVRLIRRIDDAQMEIIATVDKHKADKEDVKTLEKRVERLEDNSRLPPYADQ